MSGSYRSEWKPILENKSSDSVMGNEWKDKTKNKSNFFRTRNLDGQVKTFGKGNIGNWEGIIIENRRNVGTNINTAAIYNVHVRQK